MQKTIAATDSRTPEAPPNPFADASILLRPENLSVHSSLPADRIVDALRAVSKDGREFAVSATARAAHVARWMVRLDGGHVTIRARTFGRGSVQPVFAGTIEPSERGSTILGTLRLGWYARIFFLIWLTVSGLAAPIQVLAPLPGPIRMLSAVLMVPIAIVLLTFGLWVLRRAWRPERAAIIELLREIAGPDATVNSSAEPSPANQNPHGT